MANSSSILYLILLAFLPTLTISSTHHHDRHRHHGLKSIHFTLYQHDVVNKTDFLIVPSPFGTNITQTTSPFGTVGVINDKLTLTPDPTSKVLGSVQSISITSSFDGLDSLSICRIKLELENGLTGSLSLLGVVNALKTSDNPVVGGTGDFLFVQGYVTASPVSFQGFTYVYKQDFHLFWPPYVMGLSLDPK
ncbi:pterocarpan synthase 1-like [Silene latifolia]|uniref:pterocarpan synthase 1-like n=1 Tax=Silene latifolia TaxID=37657 RepID=UPI003D773F26